MSSLESKCGGVLQDCKLGCHVGAEGSHRIIQITQNPSLICETFLSEALKRAAHAAESQNCCGIMSDLQSFV